MQSNEGEIPEKLIRGLQEEDEVHGCQGDQDDSDNKMCLPYSQRNLPTFLESILKNHKHE